MANKMLIKTDNLWWQQQLHQNMVLHVVAGKIHQITAADSSQPDVHAHLVCPLLTDLQVNGGGGVLVNNNPTVEGLLEIAAAHRKLGTGTILPTVITDSFDVITAAAEAALHIHDNSSTRHLIGGLHIEGPHLSVQRRGTHCPTHIRPLDEATVKLVERLRDQQLPVMITLAPEEAATDLLQRLIHSGAIVSGGHSNATAEQTSTALTLGLACFTHLYNAMPPMTSRAPGILGAALDSNAYAGIIVDGIHVSWEMVRIAMRARPKQHRTFAVSDAMATVGGPETFTLYGQEIRVNSGALVNAEGALAGAHISLLESLANLVEHVGASMADAIPMVNDIPRELMQLPGVDIAPGQPIDNCLVLTETFTQMNLAESHV